MLNDISISSSRSGNAIENKKVAPITSPQPTMISTMTTITNRRKRMSSKPRRRSIAASIAAAAILIVDGGGSGIPMASASASSSSTMMNDGDSIFGRSSSSSSSTNNSHHRQTQESSICSCSPSSYSFRLNFNGGCASDTLQDNTGIDGTLCFFVEGGSPEDIAGVSDAGRIDDDEDDGEVVAEAVEIEGDAANDEEVGGSDGSGSSGGMSFIEMALAGGGNSDGSSGGLSFIEMALGGGGSDGDDSGTAGEGTTGDSSTTSYISTLLGGGGGGRQRGLRMSKEDGKDNMSDIGSIITRDSSGVAAIRGHHDDARVISYDEKKWKHLLEKVSLDYHYEHASNFFRIQPQEDKAGEQQRHRQLQLDTVPTIITSITFLEFDSNMFEIINQDSTYFETSQANGAVVTYDSISSTLNTSLPLEDQMDKVPGGVMMVLFGVNSANIVIQQTVAWGYIFGQCMVEPLNQGDSIGWTRLVGYDPPLSEFCDAVTEMPTKNPSYAPTSPFPSNSPSTTNGPSVRPSVSGKPSSLPTYTFESSELTAKPTQSPTGKPSVSPTTISPTRTPTARPTKSAKTVSSSKSSKSNGGKASGSSESAGSMSYEYGHLSKATKLFKQGVNPKAQGIQVDRPTAKATKLFKPKSKKGSTSEDDVTSTTVVNYPDAPSKSSKNGGKSSKSTKGSKSTKATAEAEHIQVTRPPTKPPTPKPQVLPIIATPTGHSTMENSMFSDSAVDDDSSSSSPTTAPSSSKPTYTPGPAVTIPVTPFPTFPTGDGGSPTNINNATTSSPVTQTLTDAPTVNGTERVNATTSPTSPEIEAGTPAPTAPSTPVPAPTVPPVTTSTPTVPPVITTLPPVTLPPITSNTTSPPSPSPVIISTAPPTPTSTTGTPSSSPQISTTPTVKEATGWPPVPTATPVVSPTVSPSYNPTQWYPTYSPTLASEEEGEMI